MLYFLYNNEPYMTSSDNIRPIEGIIFITKEEYERKLEKMELDQQLLRVLEI